MRKLVLELNESTYDKIVAMAFASEKGFSKLVNDIFEKSEYAKTLYDEMIEIEYQKLIQEEDAVYDTRT